VLGLLSFPCVFNLLTGIPAIVLAVLALRDVGASRGRKGGQGLAITGLITGSSTSTSHGTGRPTSRCWPGCRGSTPCRGRRRTAPA
jgi:hypothetical protein